MVQQIVYCFENPATAFNISKTLLHAILSFNTRIQRNAVRKLIPLRFLVILIQTVKILYKRIQNGDTIL